MREITENDAMTRRRFLALGAAGAGAFALGASDTGAAQQPSVPAGAGVRGPSPANGGLTLAWFIKRQNYASDAAFGKLLEFLKRHPEVVDEVSLFEAPSDSWLPPLNFLSETADIMARRFDALRAAGFRGLGVAVINNLGASSDELNGGAPKLQVPLMIGIGGKAANQSACPSRPEFHEYTRAKYTCLAKSSPDFVWVGDDMRMQGHGADALWACFCPCCLELFGKQTGRRFDRAGLLCALDEPKNGDLRRAWVEHNARAIESVYATIGRAVHDANPAIQTAMMTLGTAFTAYSGSAYERWFKALGATKARPGQGFYYDTSVGPGAYMPTVGPGRMDLFVKAAEAARQVESYGELVRDRQWEYETWPDGILAKEPRTALNESAAAVAVGCTGVVLDTLGFGPPYDEYGELAMCLQRGRHYLEEIVAHGSGLPAAGLWSAWSPQMMAERVVRQGEQWMPPNVFDPALPYNLNVGWGLSQFGVPICARRSGFGTVLTGRIAEALDDASLRSVLTGGVVMDTLALRVVGDRGMADLTGVAASSPHPEISTARFSGDSLNGVYSGAVVYSYANQFATAFPNDAIAVKAPGVRILAQFEDEVGNPKAPCMTAFENTSGGRVVVTGFSPWWFLNSSARRAQMTEVADWISRGTMPVRIEETAPITPFVRMNSEATKAAVLLFNWGLSGLDRVTVRIRAHQESAVRIVSADGGVTLERFSAGTGGWGVRVFGLPAWSTACLLIG